MATTVRPARSIAAEAEAPADGWPSTMRGPLTSPAPRGLLGRDMILAPELARADPAHVTGAVGRAHEGEREGRALPAQPGQGGHLATWDDQGDGRRPILDVGHQGVSVNRLHCRR